MKKAYSDFRDWLSEHSKLSTKSINNYIGGLNKVSRDLINEGWIKADLSELGLEKLIDTKEKYFLIPEYKQADLKAKNMYHAAFNRYIFYKSI
tara:strand:- start:6923 stop:7201 length:279 start_codon:yes stop_codon:yes gene_type:complete